MGSTKYGEITVFGKKNCGLCEAAKDKLRRMGFEYAEHNLSYHIQHHDGWREDGSVEAMAAHTLLNTLPIFKVEEEFLDYPGAMRELKRLSQARDAN